MDYTTDGLLVTLNKQMSVATHPTSHASPTFPRSSKHGRQFPAAEASNDNPGVTQHIVQTLLKFNHARIFLTCARVSSTNERAHRDRHCAAVECPPSWG